MKIVDIFRHRTVLSLSRTAATAYILRLVRGGGGVEEGVRLQRNNFPTYGRRGRGGTIPPTEFATELYENVLEFLTSKTKITP